MTRQHAKSGSRSRKDDVKPSRPTRPHVEPAVSRLVQETLVAAQALPKNSTLRRDTMRRLLQRIYTERGVGPCLAVMHNSLVNDPMEINTMIYPAAISVLMTHGKLKELRELMQTVRVHPFSRLVMYVTMSVDASPEQREEILASMRRIAERFFDPVERYDADFQVYLVSKDPKEWESLGQRFAQRFHIRRPLTAEDLEIMLSFAALDGSVNRMAITLDVLECAMSPSARKAAEHLLWSVLIQWDRARLNALANQVPDSRYKGEIQRLAAGARVVNDPSLSEESV